jgi:hypothetical protein
MEEAAEAIRETWKWDDKKFAQDARNFYYKQFQAAYKKEAGKSANLANYTMLVEMAPLLLVVLEAGASWLIRIILSYLASAVGGIDATVEALLSTGSLKTAAYIAASYPELVGLVEAIAMYLAVKYKLLPEDYIPSPEVMLGGAEELTARQAARRAENKSAQMFERESEQAAAKVANRARGLGQRASDAAEDFIPPTDLPPGGAARPRVPLDGATENRMVGTGVGPRARRQEKLSLSERLQGPSFSTGRQPREESQVAKATGTYGSDEGRAAKEWLGPKSTEEAIEELGRTGSAAPPREAATVGTEIEPIIEMQSWASELAKKGYKTYPRNRFGQVRIGGRRVSSMFTDERARPDMIAINDARKTIIVGDVTGNPASRARVPGQIGQDERLHIEKTIELAKQLKRQLPYNLNYKVFAQDRHWQTGTVTKLIEIQ